MIFIRALKFAYFGLCPYWIKKSKTADVEIISKITEARGTSNITDDKIYRF